MQLPIKRKKRNEAAVEVMDIDRIRKEILEKVVTSPARLTPQYLEKTIIETFGLDKPRTKAVLKELVARQQLEYTYEFGSTYLVRSFNKPVRISPHVVASPPGHQYQPSPDEVVIQIKPGAAFGGGRHPTTRLSVKAIDFLLKKVRPDWLKENGSVLDIGTGTGELARRFAQNRSCRVVGLDPSPPMIAEAQRKAAEADWGEVEFQVAEAPFLEIPYPDGAFEAVVAPERATSRGHQVNDLVVVWMAQEPEIHDRQVVHGYRPDGRLANFVPISPGQVGRLGGKERATLRQARADV